VLVVGRLSEDKIIEEETWLDNGGIISDILSGFNNLRTNLVYLGITELKRRRTRILRLGSAAARRPAITHATVPPMG
jgi:hypothetical protein